MLGVRRLLAFSRKSSMYRGAGRNPLRGIVLRGGALLVAFLLKRDRNPDGAFITRRISY